MDGISITVDTSEFEADVCGLIDNVRGTVYDVGVDLTNDMVYVTRGAAPFDTGNLENSIGSDLSVNSDILTSNIYISAYNSGFDYGALRHDKPFRLGAGSLSKSPVISKISGNSFVVGYSFAAETATGNSEDYIEYIEKEVFKQLHW